MTNQLNSSGGVGEALLQITQKQQGVSVESKRLNHKTAFDFKKLVTPKPHSDSGKAIQKEKRESVSQTSSENISDHRSDSKVALSDFPEESEIEDVEDDAKGIAALSVSVVDQPSSKNPSLISLKTLEDLQMDRTLTMKQLDDVTSQDLFDTSFKEDDLKALDMKGSVQKLNPKQTTLENLGALNPKDGEKLQAISEKTDTFLAGVLEEEGEGNSPSLGKISKIASTSSLSQDFEPTLKDQTPLDFALENKSVELPFAQEVAGKIESAQGKSPEMISQILEKMPWNSFSLKGTHQIKIQLYPEELGEVTIDLKIGDKGRIEATFAAASSATLDLLRQDSSHLLQAFKKEGFDVASDNFQFTSHEGGSQNASRENKQAPSFGHDLSEPAPLLSQTWEQKRSALLSKNFENNKVNILIS